MNEENLGNYYIVRNDDFVYNPRISVTAPVGPINRNRLGRNGVMSPLYTVFRTKNIEPLYLEYYFKTTAWHRFMKLNGDSGARFDRFTISSQTFMEMPIPYPCVEEQRKIGQYLDNLENLITLHQRKCDELQKLKKFMLQNMFTNIGNGKSHLFYDMDFIKKDKYPTGHRHEIRYKKRSFLRRMLQHIKRCCEKMSKINVSIQKKLL